MTAGSDSSISYTGVEIKFYNDEDTRIGEGLDNTEDLAAGETYAYDAMSFMSADDAEAVVAYTITVSDRP